MKEIRTSAKQMQAHYDRAPFPQSLAGAFQGSNPLLIPWINAASTSSEYVLGPRSTVLIAGCGSGEEAYRIAQMYPEASILGIDFSGKSIEAASELKVKYNLNNVEFREGDLMDTLWLDEDNSFDFVLCQAVADYVAEPRILMETFARCLTSKGVLCMMVNTPHHPAKVIREEFARVGILPHNYVDTNSQRDLLKDVIDKFNLKAKLPNLENAPLAYLEADIFAPIVHHFGIEEWCRLANIAGLNFCGALDAPIDLVRVSDSDLAHFYSMGKPQLSLVMANHSQRSSVQLLFSRGATVEPNFVNLESLMNWHVRRDATLASLPVMGSFPSEERALTFQFPGLPDFVINSSAFDLEVLTYCDGQLSLRHVLEKIEHHGNLDRLRSCLFRAYHYGLLK